MNAPDVPTANPLNNTTRHFFVTANEHIVATAFSKKKK